MIENEYRVSQKGGRYCVLHFYGDTSRPETCRSDIMGEFTTIDEAEPCAKRYAALDVNKALYVTRIDRKPSRIIYPAIVPVDDTVDVVAEFGG